MRCMHRTNIYLDDRQIALLDRLAEDRGTSRAAVIRQAIDDSLGVSDSRLERDRDLKILRTTFGKCKDYMPITRDSGEREAHLARMWQL